MRAGRTRSLRVGLAALAALFLVAGSAAAQLDAKALVPVPEPPQLRSQNGLLSTTLTARPARITVAGQRFVSNVYNGLYAPPVLRVKRDDLLRLRLVNRINDPTGFDSQIEFDPPAPTNLHYHGMAIPPRLPADYIYFLVAPGLASGLAPSIANGVHAGHGAPTADTGPVATPHGSVAPMLVTSNSYEYTWRVPTRHPQGLYWYHPHPHGISEGQVLGGMSGMLVVEGLIDEHYPELRNLKRRTFLLKDIQLPGAPDSAPKTKTINGVLGGVIQSGPGRFEVWELGNIGADSYFDIALDWHRFWVIERDGNPVSLPQLVDHIYLPPSSRAMIVVRIGPVGTYNLRTRAIATGSAGDPNPNVVLAKVISAGTPVDRRDLAERMTKPPANIATIGPTEASIRRLPVTRQRTIVYTENAAGTKFFLNGKPFDMSRVDVVVNLGDVEEWTLVNNTDERHTFHIHQLDFLVQELSGTNTLETTRGLRDNIDIPFRDPWTRVPGKVKVKIPFTNPVIVGMFPFHCHILEHEDGGMMQNLVVLPAPPSGGG